MASTIDSMMPTMPGSYMFHHDRSRSNNNSHNIFQPPAQSPTPSHRSSQIPRPVSRSSNSHSSRKRPRLNANTSYFSRPTRPSTHSRSNTSTPFYLDGSYDNVAFNNLDSSTYSLDNCSLASPSPLANSEYRLAGGLDTPCASFEKGLEQLAQDEAERDYRFNRYTTTNTSRTTFSAESSGKLAAQPETPDVAVNHDSRKRTRSPPKHSRSLTGWGIRSTAWAFTGGLAGRVFNFCVNTAFGGFRAGGGQPYQMDIGTPEINGMGSFQMGVSSSMFSNDYGRVLNLPGEYPDLGGFVEDYMNSPEARRTEYNSTPTAQYSQWDIDDYDRSVLKNDWQIIDQVTLTENGEDQSPARKRSRASVAGNWQRPVSRNSMHNRNATTSASYASPRARPSLGPGSSHQRTASSGPFQPVRRSRPSVANSRRATSYLPAPAPISLGQRSPERPSSSASNRRETQGFGSGVSPEVVNYKRQMKAREKEQDENLRRLNAQLRDMIREGKEALGSRVEIVDEQRNSAGYEFDEGYCEDGWK